MGAELIAATALTCTEITPQIGWCFLVGFLRPALLKRLCIFSLDIWCGLEGTPLVYTVPRPLLNFSPMCSEFEGMPGLTSKHWLYYNIFLIWMPYCLVNVSVVQRSFSLLATVFHHLRNASIWTIKHRGSCHRKNELNTLVDAPC